MGTRPIVTNPVKYLSARDVGNIFGISYPTIWRILTSKQLHSVRIHPGKQYKIPASEVLRYAEEHNIPLSNEHRQLLEEMNLQSGGLEINAELSEIEESSEIEEPNEIEASA